MDHPIFKAAVLIESQEESDIAKDICLKYSLPVWKEIDLGFDWIDYDDDDIPTYLYYDDTMDESEKSRVGFFVDDIDDDIDNYNIISIKEFETLANDLNPIFIEIEDILSKLKEINNILNNKL
jgi:hypothetical protein